MLLDTTPAQHIQYAHASVDVINSIIAGGVFDSEALDKLARNAEHLQGISASDYASQFPSDIAVFALAINAAQAHLPTK